MKLKHTVSVHRTHYACIIDGKVFIEKFSFDYLSVIFRLRGHKQRLQQQVQRKNKKFRVESSNEKLSAIYNNDSEYINDLKRSENDVD